MNVYDTVNRLATELKESEEYVNYKMAKETLSLKPDLKKKIQEFEDARYDAQISAMQTGKSDEEKNEKTNICNWCDSIGRILICRLWQF